MYGKYLCPWVVSKSRMIYLNKNYILLVGVCSNFQHKILIKLWFLSKFTAVLWRENVRIWVKLNNKLRYKSGFFTWFHPLYRVFSSTKIPFKSCFWNYWYFKSNFDNFWYPIFYFTSQHWRNFARLCFLPIINFKFFTCRFSRNFRDGNFTRGKMHCIGVCPVSSLFILLHDVLAKFVKVIKYCDKNLLVKVQ